MSTAQIQEAVEEERKRCVRLVEGIRDGLLRDANQPALDTHSTLKERFIEAANVADMIAHAIGRDP